MSKISILCPSRMRPEQLQLMIESAISKSSGENELEFCIYIDFDDLSYQSDNYRFFDNSQIKFIKGPRFWLSGMFNSLTTIATGEYIFWCGDDVNFITTSWDKIMISKFDNFPDKMLLVHANDMATTYKQEFATIGMVHRNWIHLFGNLFTPHMKDNGIDFWISEIANIVDRRCYAEEVQIEHRQYRQGKSDLDSTYKDRLINQQTYNPRDLYRKLAEERRRDALVLGRYIGMSKIPFNKKFLLGSLYARIFHTNKVQPFSNRWIYFQSMSNLTFLRFIFYKIKLLPDSRNWK